MVSFMNHNHLAAIATIVIPSLLFAIRYANKGIEQLGESCTGGYCQSGIAIFLLVCCLSFVIAGHFFKTMIEDDTAKSKHG